MTASDGASKYKVVETPASGKVSCYEIDSSGTENLVSETTESDNSIQAKYYRDSATDTVTVNMSDYGNVTSMFYDGNAVEYGYFFHPTSGYASQMTYDSAGNPLQWKGNVLQWDRGRRLIGYGSNGYTYDSGGIRQSKTVNGITHTYYTEDGTIHKEELSDGNKLIYGYDESGIASIEYGNTRYYVQKNVQGNVVALVDGNKAVVAKYIYDAWGNHKVLDAAGTENTSDDFIGNINPIRYRGYYYDRETNLYYLINRYYDSETGRFISPDQVGYALMGAEEPNGLNIYAYSLNNPIMGVDPTGQAVWWEWLLFGITVVAATAIGIAATVMTSGLASAVLAGAAFGYASSAVSNVVSQAQSFGVENVNLGSAYLSGALGAVIGAVSGVVSFGFVEAGKAIGNMFGHYASAALKGTKFAKVFGTTFVPVISGIIGTVGGTAIGTYMGEVVGNGLFGKQYDIRTEWKDTVSDSIFGWLADFIKWLFKI